MVVNGKILKVSSSGCLVSLGGASEIKAFCPILFLAEVRLSKPEKRFPVGSEHKFQVFNIEKSRILVTAKKSLLNSSTSLEAPPFFFQLSDELKGCSVRGVVTAIKDTGCSVSFANGLYGFLPKKEMRLVKFNHPKLYVLSSFVPFF